MHLTEYPNWGEPNSMNDGQVSSAVAHGARCAPALMCFGQVLGAMTTRQKASIAADSM